MFEQRVMWLPAAALAASLVGASAPVAQAQTEGSAAPITRAAPRIVNGLATQGFPTTGALLHSDSAITLNNAETWCSGTLIGCQTFLTAAHCVADDGSASHYWVYLQHGGIHAVSSVTYHPDYDGSSGRDVAIVRLSSPVTGIDPTPFNSTHDLDALGVGLPGTIAGFGRTGGGSDYGVKRYGEVVTAGCEPALTGGEGDDVLVCWNFDLPIGPAGEDSNTCNGDSGGPLFMDFSGTTEVVGVTSAGVMINCGAGDHSWDASVYYNASWIAGQLGADSTSACGGLPPVGDADTVVTANSGTLDLLTLSASFNVTLTGAPTLARFTLNGTDNGFNPNMFVKQGSGASPSNYDCAANGSSVFGACQFDSPAAGTWSVFVQRLSGTGRFQVTTTVFGGDPALCGNGVVEYGEQCDGASDEACPGQCEADCRCTQACTSGDLYGISLVSDDDRFSYKARLYDTGGSYASLDPRADELTLDVTDTGGSVSIAIPASDPGWVKADPVRRKYGWKGDGSLGGLRRARLVYKHPSSGAYWNLAIRGSSVAGAGSLDLASVLAFELGFDGTCHLESW